jgi:hypothetical protein
MWLEDYVANLPVPVLFEGAQFAPQQEAEWDRRPDKRPKPGTIAWTLAVEQAKKLGVSQGKKPQQVHLAVQQLMRERQQLVNVADKSIRLGILLDEVELAKQHGELLVKAMTAFAIANGLDPTDKNVVKAILTALDEVSGPAT